MAEPRSPAHEPKLAALIAHAEGRLRPAAQARLERHVAGCATCREAQRGLQRYALLAGDTDDHELPAIDWARIETALRPEAARLARRPRVRALRWAGFGLAATASIALGFMLTRTAHAPSASRAPESQPRPAPSVQPAPVVLYAEITALAGAPLGSDAAGRALPLTLESRPSEGWALETDADAEVHVAVPGVAGLVVPASSRVELRALRPGEVELALVRGQIISQVNPRAAGERYEVVAAGRRVRVHGTRFGVELLPDALAVQVDEGVVQVLSEDGTLIAELTAPQRWVERGQQGQRERSLHALRRPRPPSPDSANWPVVQLPTWPAIQTWELAGTEIGARGDLKIRVPPGRLQILGQLGDGRRMRSELQVDAIGARFDPRALRWVTGDPPKTPARPTDASDASTVIRAGQPALQRCYERSQRAQSATSSTILRVRLRIEIDARGDVRRATLVDGQGAPEGFAACISQVARAWRFAAPGGAGLAFEAPLQFRPAH